MAEVDNAEMSEVKIAAEDDSEQARRSSTAHVLLSVR
jgi:hypothetical protein